MIEKRLEERQARLLEILATVTQEITGARFELQQAADENRRLRYEAERVNLKVYTEEEAAAELKMSEKTLQRHRLSHPDAWPCFYSGSLVRYTNVHLVEITEILDRRKERATKKGKGAHLSVAARAS
jgi:regulator of replication initiation timing